MKRRMKRFKLALGITLIVAAITASVGVTSYSIYQRGWSYAGPLIAMLAGTSALILLIAWCFKGQRPVPTVVASKEPRLSIDDAEAFFNNFIQNCEQSPRLDAVQTSYFCNWAKNIVGVPITKLPADDNIQSVKVTRENHHD